jgi:hypothetical protein
MSQFEKTKPISAKVSVSAFLRKDYESMPRRSRRENKANLPAFGRKSEAPLPSQGQARPRENGDTKSETMTPVNGTGRREKLPGARAY